MSNLKNDGGYLTLSDNAGLMQRAETNRVNNSVTLDTGYILRNTANTADMTENLGVQIVYRRNEKLILPGEIVTITLDVVVGFDPNLPLSSGNTLTAQYVHTIVWGDRNTMDRVVPVTYICLLIV